MTGDCLGKLRMSTVHEKNKEELRLGFCSMQRRVWGGEKGEHCFEG